MADNYTGQEKRKAERLEAAFTITFQVESPIHLRFEVGWDNDLDGLMLNLSSLGMAIITRHDLSVGTQIYAKFSIIDFNLQGEERWQHMEITGKVVFNIRLSRVSHKIGIRFDRISYRDKRLIADFVKRNKIYSKWSPSA